MSAIESTGKRRVRRRSAADRERLIEEFQSSGLTKKAFCEKRGINVGTFQGWFQRDRKDGGGSRKGRGGSESVFTELLVSGPGEAPVEILLPNGARVCIRPLGKAAELAELIRGVTGYGGAR